MYSEEEVRLATEQLYKAAHSGDLVAVKQALEKGADPTGNGIDDSTLSVAAANGHLSVIQTLYDHVGRNLQKLRGATTDALVNAIRGFHHETVRWLCENDKFFVTHAFEAGLHTKDSPLSAAVEREDQELIQYFIDNGLILTDKDSLEEIYSCMKLALSKDNQIREILYKKFLQDNPAPLFTTYLLLGCYDNLDSLKWLHQQGINLSAKDDSGRTVLHKIAQASSEALMPQASLETVRWLCENGADINSMDEMKRTPLFYALHGRNYEHELVLLLLQYEAEVADNTVCELTLGINRYIFSLTEEACGWGEQLIEDAIYDDPAFIFNYAGAEWVHTRKQFVQTLKGHVSPGSHQTLDLIDVRVLLCEFYEKTLAISLLTGESIEFNQLDDDIQALVKDYHSLFINDLLRALKGTHPIVKTDTARTAFRNFGVQAIKDHSIKDHSVKIFLHTRNFLEKFLPYLSPDEILYFLDRIDTHEVCNANNAKFYCEFALNIDDKAKEWGRIWEESGELDQTRKSALIKISWYSLTLLLLAKAGSDQSTFNVWRLLAELSGKLDFGRVNFESFDDLSDKNKLSIINYICANTGWADRKFLQYQLVRALGYTPPNITQSKSHMFTANTKREREETPAEKSVEDVTDDKKFKEDTPDSKGLGH